MKYIDPDGRELLSHITITFTRNIDSPSSRGNSALQGLDSAVITNHETGESLIINGGQTVSNHSQYPVGNTIQAYSGYFQMQYLGEGEEQPLYNDFGSSYKGPLFNILNANTEGFSKTDSMGRIIGSEDTTPIRMHSDTTLDGKKVGLFSGGCPMFPLSELEEVQQKLEEWGVKRGDTFNGYIKQDFPQ